MSNDPLELACDIMTRKFGLTGRERDVLSILACGRPLADIERELCVARNTAKTHVRHIYAKLGVHSRAEVVAMVRSVSERAATIRGE